MNDFEYFINGKKVSADEYIDCISNKYNKLQKEKEDLIKYLEECKKEANHIRDCGYSLRLYTEILEKVKNGKNE